MANYFKLIVAIVVSELAGVIGSTAFTTGGSGSGLDWYAGLAKPALNPPAWVFGPVWTVLYALIGISAFLIWREYDKLTLSGVAGPVIQRQEQHSNILQNVRMLRLWKIGIAAFFTQLFLNALWSIIFFGLHGSTWLTINSTGWALVDIVLLWLAIVWTMTVFYKISRLAAYLLVPYLLWVSFAVYLNYAIWTLN